MRQPVKSKADKENEPVEKPPKRRKTKPTRLGDIVEEMDEEDRKTFDDDVEMKKETAKKKTKVAHLKPLMHSTFSGRRHWIQRDMPPVTDIMQKFPALKIPRLVC